MSAQGDESKTVELAPIKFIAKSFPRPSRSRGDGVASIYKYNLGSNITFNTIFDFTHTSFEVTHWIPSVKNAEVVLRTGVDSRFWPMCSPSSY